MIAQRLLDELRQLNQEERLQVIQFLTGEEADVIDKYFEGTRVFTVRPRYIATENAVSTLRRAVDELKDNA